MLRTAVKSENHTLVIFNRVRYIYKKAILSILIHILSGNYNILSLRIYDPEL